MKALFRFRRRRRGISAKPYKYSALKGDEIRLLTLKPGLYEAPLAVTFDIVSLHSGSNCTYEALSYVWGSTSDPGPIAVSSLGWRHKGTLLITRNLDAALRHLRYEREARILWVDALCINQADLQERSRQVSRMGSIFGKAECVVAWIGEEADNSAQVLKRMAHVASEISVDWVNADMSPSMNAEDKDLGDVREEASFSDGELASIFHLLDRSWFKRLWIRQEILLASKAVLVCGYDQISWDAFSSYVVFLSCKDSRDYDALTAAWYTSFYHARQHVLDLCRRPVQDNFIIMLSDARACICSDPRDRIYALLSLVQRVYPTFTVIPNYSLKVSTVFEDAVVRWIQFSKILDILRNCDSATAEPGMPSWVPNLAVPTLALPINTTAGAGGDSLADVAYTRQGLLNVKGAVICQVQYVREFKFPVNARHNLPAIQVQVRRMLQASVSNEPGNRAFVLEQFCRALVSDCFSSSFDDFWKDDLPDFAESLSTLTRWLESKDTIGLEERTTGRHYLNRVAWQCPNRSLITTSEGKLGIGPASTAIGDLVCVLLGCNSPLILREEAGGRYKVVGECHVNGLTYGEGLLGDLPSPWAYHRSIYPNGDFRLRFLNTETLVLTENDPRLPPLERDLQLSSTTTDNEEYVPYPDPMTAQALEARGVNIRTFCLV